MASSVAELEWITEAERGAVSSIQAKLAAELPDYPAAYPPWLTHDIHACRFLRGHKRDPATAAVAMAKAVRYRSELTQEGPVRDMREALGDATQLDLSLLPHSADVMRCLPFRTLQKGGSASGLPLTAIPFRLVDVRAFNSISDKLDLFLRAMLESRALVLHNLSMQQQRMVKFVELRDFNNVYVSEMLAHGQPLIQRLKGVIGALQDHYPELVHQAIISHAPSTFSRLFSLVSSALNERMRSKIVVVPATESFSRVAELLDPQALHSWAMMLEPHVDWSAELVVANGASEFTARWVEAGESVEWGVRLVTPDSTVRVVVYWMDQPGRPELLQDLTVKSGDTARGRRLAAASGVAWVCVDNVASWWYARNVTADIKVVPAAGPEVDVS